MSNHEIRDRVIKRHIEAGSSPKDARRDAIASLNRCDRDKARDDRRKGK